MLRLENSENVGEKGPDKKKNEKKCQSYHNRAIELLASFKKDDSTPPYSREKKASIKIIRL